MRTRYSTLLTASFIVRILSEFYTSIPNYRQSPVAVGCRENVYGNMGGCHTRML